MAGAGLSILVNRVRFGMMIRRRDSTDARPLALPFPDDHQAFHEDAKPGDLMGQFGTRSFST